MRTDVLKYAKKILIKNGWNSNLFYEISSISNYKEEEIKSLFPNGYQSLLEFYLNNFNLEMINYIKKMNLNKYKTHEKIKKIILIKIKILEKEKKLFRRTFTSLLLPHNTKLAISYLYETVNQIWYLAGDNSTDFNFYTKRIILSGIYSSTILYWINNDINIDELDTFLDKQLNKINNIPKTKEKLKSVFKIFPKIFSLYRNS